MKKISLLLILFLLSQNTDAQEEKELQFGIQLVSNEHLAEVNFDAKDFTDIIGATLDEFETKLKTQKLEKGHIFLVQTFHKDRAPSYAVHACPSELSKEVTIAISTNYTNADSIRAKLMDYGVIYVAMVKEGCSEAEFELKPAYIDPKETVVEALQAADLKGKVNLIQQWVKTEVIPVLSAFELSVERDFAGVRSMGHLMNDIDFNKQQNIAGLTEKSEDYWRALMEMAPRNHLISISKIMMHIAAGEFDYAKPYIDLSSFFSDAKSAPSYYLEELKWRMRLFQEALDAEIQKGIAFHDAAEYEAAIKQYEQILNAYPNSAWANYELYYTKNAKMVKDGLATLEDRKLWDEMKGTVYACNPLYHMDVRSSNAQEGYLLFRRLQTQQLFKEKDKFLSDLFEYAEIALDLEVNAFAAHLYWYIYTTIDAKKYETKEPLKYYLYAMHRMGITDFDKLFKDIKASDFKKIDKERETKMKDSKIYQSFKKK